MSEAQDESNHAPPECAEDEHRISIVEPFVLLVEGKDEYNFFDALQKHLRLPRIQLVNFEGRDNLQDVLEAVVKDSGFGTVVSLGIELDANSDSQAAFDRIRGALQNPDLGVELPVPQRALTPATGAVKVTGMVLPGEATRGSLEDLCLRAFSGNPEALCADGFFECLTEQNMPRPRQPSKAKMHVFLAAQREFRKDLGWAAFQDYWPWGDSAFDQVKSFLREVAA